MNVTEIPSLEIFKGEVSKRLFFAKTSHSDGVWHILDFGISQQHRDGKSVISMALHQEWILPAIQADTIEELTEKTQDRSESICDGCLQEFELAKDIIMERSMMDFRNPNSRIIIP